VKALGFEGLTDKIRELNNTLENPNLTDSQREQIQRLIGSYQDMRRDAALSFSTLADGWSSAKGIGSGIESITGALEGNANAWQAVTGIVDGFIQIYEGISAIVGIIDMQSSCSTASISSCSPTASAWWRRATR